MAKKSETQIFTVEGSGQFPFDMLRYDSCWPHSSMDAARLEPSRRERRRVVLETAAKSKCAARWHSFGWDIIGSGALRGDVAA